MEQIRNATSRSPFDRHVRVEGAIKTASTAPCLQIALVDDDEDVFARLKEMAKAQNWDLVFYSDGRDAVRQIPATEPDLVLMEILMPGLSGIDCTEKLKCHSPDLPVLMHTASSAFDHIISSMMVGATGYLLKPLSLDQLKDAVSRTMHGGCALCEEAQSAMLTCFRRTFETTSSFAFSKREMQIMMGLIQHLSDKEIAAQLNIATNTVHVHLVRIFQLLGVHDRNEAVQKFFGGCLGASCYRCPILDNNVSSLSGKANY